MGFVVGLDCWFIGKLYVCMYKLTILRCLDFLFSYTSEAVVGGEREYISTVYWRNLAARIRNRKSDFSVLGYES